MLDLRYNEMWNDWNGNGESLEPNKFDHDHLVLSWKRLNVSVKKTTHKFFKSSETTYKQILHNGQYRVHVRNKYDSDSVELHAISSNVLV